MNLQEQWPTTLGDPVELVALIVAALALLTLFGLLAGMARPPE